MKLPDKIQCQVTVYNKPKEGILLKATFGVISKNSYSFIFGPTDKHGLASLHKSTVVHEAGKQLELAFMDYHPIESAFSGEISVHPMSEDDIKRALEGAKIFRDVFPFKEGYELMLQTALKKPLLRNLAIDIKRID